MGVRGDAYTPSLGDAIALFVRMGAGLRFTKRRNPQPGEVTIFRTKRKQKYGYCVRWQK